MSKLTFKFEKEETYCRLSQGFHDNRKLTADEMSMLVRVMRKGIDKAIKFLEELGLNKAPAEDYQEGPQIECQMYSCKFNSGTGSCLHRCPEIVLRQSMKFNCLSYSSKSKEIENDQG
jgi:hypothetical protein